MEESILPPSFGFKSKYGRIVIAPTMEFLILLHPGRFSSTERIFFSSNGNPLAPVPPNIDDMIKEAGQGWL